MDLSTETSLEKLKAMAYDQIAVKELAENNLRVLNQRIQEIGSENTGAEQEGKQK